MALKRTELKRKTPLRAKVPMRRTASSSSTKPERAAPAPRKRMKSTRPKMTPIRKAARGEDCTVMIAGVCNRDPATTVLCHSNRLADGKGMGLKAPDTEACFGCSACHDVLDGRRPLPGWMSKQQLADVFDRARTITHEKLKQKGLM
jgi:hypothetical protein